VPRRVDEGLDQRNVLLRHRPPSLAYSRSPTASRACGGDA
jgi:hypothetical protein